MIICVVAERKRSSWEDDKNSDLPVYLLINHTQRLSSGPG